MTVAQRRRLDALIDDLSSASFECGEWERNESDEPYDDVHARSIKARARLDAFLARLTARPVDPS